MAHLGVNVTSSESELEVEEVGEVQMPPASCVALSPGSEQERQLLNSQLHFEVESLSAMLQIDQTEFDRKTEIIQIVRNVSLNLFQHEFRSMKVEPFGGFANGLGTKGSDLDIVLSGILVPDGQQGGFSDKLKPEVTGFLRKLIRSLTSKLVIKNENLIRSARIPILKLKTQDGIDLDISIGNSSGPRASSFVKEKVEKLPALRPLVLAVKSMLQKRCLNDVAAGGLGTYSLANMAIAYIQHRQAHDEDVTDFGDVLIGFLSWYEKFDVKRWAVSLLKGNFCDKRNAVTEGENPFRRRLCIQDCFTGYDISGGTSKIDEIQKLFKLVWRSLKKHKGKPAFPDAYGTFPCLSDFIDVRVPLGTMPTEETPDLITWPKRKRFAYSPRETSVASDRSSVKKSRSEGPKTRSQTRSREECPLPPPLPPPIVANKGPNSISNLYSTVFLYQK